MLVELVQLLINFSLIRWDIIRKFHYLRVNLRHYWLETVLIWPCDRFSQ